MAYLVFLAAILFFKLSDGTHMTDKIYKWTRHSPVGYTNAGKSLDGHWFYKTFKQDVTLCAYQCRRRTACLSFNYDSDSSECTLNRKAHDTVALVDAASSTVSYHARDEFEIDPEALGPCAGDICNNHGRCLETKTADDQLIAICVCKKGWGGSRCDLTEDEPQWGAWNTWESCSVTCNKGWRMRRRNCEILSTGQTLNVLECYGREFEYETCQLQDCPRWDEWGTWDQCTTYQTCGRGFKVRHRVCSNGGSPGVDRYCLGPTNESTICYGINCQGPIRLRGGSIKGEGRVEIFNDITREWGLVCADQWTQHAAELVCKQMGLPGAHLATQDSRFGTGSGHYGITSLTCTGSERTVQMCDRNPWSLNTICPGTTEPAGVMCKVNGIWSLWEEWGGCSVTCEEGTRERTRACNHPPALHGGRDCIGETLQTMSCQGSLCPGNATWLNWSIWGSCDVTCGVGERFRQRDCVNGTSETCVGSSADVQTCVTATCAPEMGTDTPSTELPTTTGTA